MFTTAFNNNNHNDRDKKTDTEMSECGTEAAIFSFDNVITSNKSLVSDNGIDNLQYAKSTHITRGVAATMIPQFKPIGPQSHSMDSFDWELDTMSVRPISMLSTMQHNCQTPNLSTPCKQFESMKLDLEFSELDIDMPTPMKVKRKSSSIDSDSENYEISDIFIPSRLSNCDVSMEPRIRKDDGCLVKPNYYNEYTCCTMVEKPIYVLKSVFMLCQSYNSDNREIECVIDETEFEIAGTVYMKHKPVKFIISVWHENDKIDILTRIEFLKLRGDSMIFQQFWSEMLELMHTKSKFEEIISVCDRCDNFESLFMPTFEFEDSYQMTKNDLDNLVMDLKQDYRDSGIEALATLCENIDKNDLLFCRLVAQHQGLINVLIKNILSHFDVSHARGGLCVLSKIIASGVCDNQWIQQLIDKSMIMDQLILLLENKSKLIQKHCVRLMSQLSYSPRNWNLNGKQQKRVQSAIKFIQLSCEMVDMEKMFENIGNKIDVLIIKQSF